jgi:hypothetical protein
LPLISVTSPTPLLGGFVQVNLKRVVLPLRDSCSFVQRPFGSLGT